MSKVEAGKLADLDAVAGCCRILGALFYYPPDNAALAPVLAFLQQGQWPQAWPFGAADELGRIGADMASALADLEAMGALVEEHQRLFIGPNHLDAPPWGSVYLEEEGTLFGDSTLALRHFLETEGVILQTEQHEPEDHIGLLFWAAAWLAEAQRPVALRHLIDEHMLSWSNAYLNQLGGTARHPFYLALERLARVTLDALQSRRPQAGGGFHPLRSER